MTNSPHSPGNIRARVIVFSLPAPTDHRSFLLQPTPAWGLMLQGGAEEYAESAPWIAIFPGLAISLAVFGFNLFGDAVRDTLDPRLRSE